MLHILLLILKIIGIILAVILGILVLLVCIVLFVPVRYSGNTSCEGTLESLNANIKITWLFPLVVFSARYKDRQFHYGVRIAWKRLNGEDEEQEDHVHETKTETHAPSREHKKVQKSVEKLEHHHGESQKTPNIPKKITEAKQNKENEKHVSKLDKLIERWKQMWKKMKCTISSFYDKIKVLLEKKEKVSAFIYDETHQKAFQKVKTELVVLLKRWCPKKIKADVIFGFEDPYRTGQVLAGLGVIYSFIGKETTITPDFEQRIFKGNIYIKGKLAAVYLVSLLWKLFWCKAVRHTYKDIKNFKV